jgi:4-hydroxy-4-methyl-2-oxoglutarate aldolase
MIGEPPLLRIQRHFKRPSAEQIAAFTGLQTGFVVDAMNGRGALDGRIKSFGAVHSFCGAALPCYTGPNDNLAAFGALSVAMPGDVIMCATDNFERSAVTGDLLLGMMKNSGVAAFVTDGFVRDRAGILATGLPCFAAGVTPNSPVRNGPGTVGLPAVVGGVAVSTGDIVLGDEDGVVIIPGAQIDATIKRLEVVRAAELDLDTKVKGGLTVPDFILKLIAAGKFKEVD